MIRFSEECEYDENECPYLDEGDIVPQCVSDGVCPADMDMPSEDEEVELYE